MCESGIPTFYWAEVYILHEMLDEQVNCVLCFLVEEHLIVLPVPINCWYCGLDKEKWYYLDK